MKYYVRHGEHEHEVELTSRNGELEVRVDGELIELAVEELGSPTQLLARSGLRSHAVSIEGGENQLGISLAGHFYALEVEDERERAARAAARRRGGASGVVKSVMPGIVVQVFVQPGQRVEAGAPLLILEAMKMQNEIDAPMAGEVAELHVEAGRTVGAGDRLVTLRTTEPPTRSP